MSLDAYRIGDGQPVPDSTAIQLWARAARDLLTETARKYGASVTDTTLAGGIQSRTSIRTKAPLADWLGEVLTTAGADARRRDEPLLASLCVDADGKVGARYRELLVTLDSAAVENPEWHAAEQRLACYQRYAASMPADGGRPTLIHQATRPTASRSRPTRRSPAHRKAVDPTPAATCPTCFMELPVTGVCDTCG